MDKNISQDIEFANKHSDAISGWYPLEKEDEGIMPHPNGTVNVPNATSYATYRRRVQTLRYAIANRKLTVHGLTGNLQPDFIMSNRSLLTIPAIVNHVKNAGLDGYLLDFEPQNTLYHNKDIARNYSRFIHALGRAMHVEGLELGIDVADFSAVSVNQDFFDQYAVGSSVDFFTSMSPTYSGANTSEDTLFAEKLKKKVGRERTRIGIGSMPPGGTPTEVFNWTESKLNYFTTYLKSRHFEHIDIWPCYLSSCPIHDETATWFFQPLANFLKS